MENGWIPITPDTLPTENGDTMVMLHGKQKVRWFSIHFQMWDKCRSKYNKPSHWRPLFPYPKNKEC